MVIKVTGSNDIHNWISAAKVGSAINPGRYDSSLSTPGFAFETQMMQLIDPTFGEDFDQLRFTSPSRSYRQHGVMASHIGSTDSFWDDYAVTGMFSFGGVAKVDLLVFGTLQFYQQPIGIVRDKNPPNIQLTDIDSAGSPGDRYYAIMPTPDTSGESRVSLVGFSWDQFAFLSAAKALRLGNGTPLEALLDQDVWEVNGTASANLIFGHAKNDILRGNGGNDFMSGGGGDDNIDGGTDNDNMDGGAGNDTLFGDSGNDVVNGGTGNDLVMGGRGNDTVDGGDGNDDLWGHEDSNIIRGGSGDDTFHSFVNGINDVNGNSGNDRYVLGAGADTITDDSGYDTMQFTSAAYADWISGTWLADLGNDNWHPAFFERYELTAGADTLVMRNDFLTSFSIIGGAGIDFIIGGGGSDLIWGDAGNDRLQGQSGDDALSGGDGLDNVIGDAGRDRLRGGLGNDNLNGGADIDTAEFDDHFGNFSGGWNINLLTGQATTMSSPGSFLGIVLTETDTLTSIESIIASTGNDTIQAKEGTVLSNPFVPLIKPMMDGAAGNDTLILAPTIISGITLSGTTVADDVVTYTGLNQGSVKTATQFEGSGVFVFTQATGYLDFKNIETLDTGQGNDRVTGSGFKDTVKLGIGNDTAILGNGDDIAFGGAGLDILTGGDGNDSLFGEADVDTISGGNGLDNIMGGVGADKLSGGLNADKFFYVNTADGTDVISDFAVDDFFAFKGTVFGETVKGALTASHFWTNTTGVAHDADDRFIFNTTDDTLWYDSNGNAAGGAFKMADMNIAFNLTAADVLIV
jgi:Ca2+-binding RTX toxin-like protein